MCLSLRTRRLKYCSFDENLGCNSLDYLDPGYSTNGNLTVSSKSDATSNFSASHR